MNEKKIKIPNIQYRLEEIKKINFFQRDYESLGLTKQEIKKGDVSLSSKIDFKEQGVVFWLKSDFFIEKDSIRKDLFGIETSYSFAVKNFKKIFYDEELNVWNVPDPIMGTFMGITVSGTRGMLAALVTDPDYSKIYLPLVNPIELLKGLKLEEEKPPS
jgi:hypothetical protein